MEIRKTIDSKPEGARKHGVLADMSNNKEGRLNEADLDHIRRISSEFSLYLKSDGYNSRIGCISVNGMHFKVKETTMFTPGMFLAFVFKLYDYEMISSTEFKKLSKMAESAAQSDSRALIEIKKNGRIIEETKSLRRIKRK